MGWRDSINTWLSDTSQFITQTAYHVVEGISTLPTVAQQGWQNEQAYQVSQSALRILAEDIAPFLVLHSGLTAWQTYVEDSLAEYPDAWMTYWALQSVSSVLETSFCLYRLRQQTRLTARTGILTLENNQTWSNLRATDTFTLCHDKGCSSARFLQGNLRDLGVFYLTEMGLYFLHEVPYVGWASIPLSVYHKGRYALASVMPELCQREQLDYLDNHRALALSLGLIHQGSLQSMSYFISYMGHIPTTKIRALLDAFLLLPTVAVAARMPLPTPNTTRHAVAKPLLSTDPMTNYQRLTGWGVDVVLYGLKKKLPALLKGPENNIDWALWQQRYQWLITTVPVRLAGLVLVADCFHGVDRLKQDPVIAQFWTDISQTVASIARGLADWGDSYPVKALTYNDLLKKVSTKLANWYLHYPPSLVKLVVKVIGSEPARDALRQFADFLDANSDALQTSSTARWQAALTSFGQSLERSLHINHHDAYQTAFIMVELMVEAVEPLRLRKEANPNPSIPPTPFKKQKESVTLFKPTEKNKQSPQPKRLFPKSKSVNREHSLFPENKVRQRPLLEPK